MLNTSPKKGHTEFDILQESIIDLVNLILLVVVIAVFYRLRSVLGMRNEEDDNTGRHDAYRLNREAFDAAKDAPKGPPQDTPPAGDAEPAGVSEPARPFAEPTDDTPIEAGKGLTLVREKDPDFDEGAFVEGARKLYEMILLDFAAGDLTGVKGFLGPDVLAGFEAAIHQREEAGEHLITEIHALARPVIEDAEYDNGVVRLSVRYSADLVSHVSGAGAEEHAPSPVRSRDLWTFERHVQSDSPNWLLIATQTE